MITVGFKSRSDLLNRLKKINLEKGNVPVLLNLPGSEDLVTVYPASVRKSGKGGIFAAGKWNNRRTLLLMGSPTLNVFQKYEGEVIYRQGNSAIIRCGITRPVLDMLRRDLPFYKPDRKQTGSKSISFGDALGLSAGAVLRAFADVNAQACIRQSIHEIKKLELHPADTRDAATWTLFQEGYESGMVAEACHISAADELLTMLSAGYTRFSIEPLSRETGQFKSASKRDLLNHILALPWTAFRDSFELIFSRYRGKRLELGPVESTNQEFRFQTGTDEKPETRMIVPDEREVLSAICTYSDTIMQFVQLEKTLVLEGVRDEVTLEISFECCEESLTPFDHYFIINELMRRDVLPDFIAPGRLDLEHIMLAHQSGLYGLSGRFDNSREWQHFVENKLLPGVPLHAVFPDISYLTALACIAEIDRELFRKIWQTSRNHFEKVRKNSDTTLKIDHIESAAGMTDEALSGLLKRPYSVIFLSLTMPEIMTIRDGDGNRYLKQEIYNCLYRHEERFKELLYGRYRYAP